VGKGLICEKRTKDVEWKGSCWDSSLLFMNNNILGNYYSRIEEEAKGSGVCLHELEVIKHRKHN